MSLKIIVYVTMLYCILMYFTYIYIYIFRIYRIILLMILYNLHRSIKKKKKNKKTTLNRPLKHKKKHDFIGETLAHHLPGAVAPALLLCPRQSAPWRARWRLGFGVEPGEAVARQSGLADGSPGSSPVHPIFFGWCLVSGKFTKGWNFAR